MGELVSNDALNAIDRQIPTALSYADGDEYYGAQAKAFLVRNPSNTIVHFRDFLGQE
jgi:molecular chaperone DnaK (HSP70)